MTTAPPDGRGKFAGGDQEYLRDVQYRDPSRLTARADLHARYGTAAVPWFSWVAAQIRWPERAEVLEVGCGPGWLWAEAGGALPAGLRVTVTDLSPGMVAAAAERVRASPHLELVDASEVDAQALPFVPASFDITIANHMLYHVPDPARAVGELARVLRADGVLVAATCGARHLRELWEIQAEVFGTAPSSETIEVFGAVTGVPILEAHFADVEWREYEDELRCTDPADVVAFMTSTPPGEDASPDDLERLRRAVERRFAVGDGVMTVSKEAGVFIARGPRAPARPAPA